MTAPADVSRPPVADVADARPRLAERRLERRRRLLRRLLPLLGLLVLAGVAVWLVFFSSVLGVRTVQVAGVERWASEDAVRAAAAVPDGHPLARLDTGAVAERVGALAPVASVAVERDWPSTVRIVVQERRPFARVELDGRLRLVDGDGVAFADAPESSRLPRLSVGSPAPDDPATRAGLDVLAALPVEIRRNVARVQVPGPNEVTLHLVSGKRVVWGDARRSAAKARVLGLLLDRPGEVYDVSTPEVVTVR